MAFNGKICAVTASTAGIGLACVKKLLVEGAETVYVSSRRTANVEKCVGMLQESFGENRVKGITCHVGDKSQRDKLWQEIKNNSGRLDCFVSNAAANPYFGPILKTPEQAWQKILDVNVTSSALLVQEAVPLLQKSSTIVLISSIGAKLPFPGLGAYNVSKTAMMGLVKNFSPELARKGIRINGVLPGVIQTDFSRLLWESEQGQANIKNTFDLKRPGTSEEVANLVSFLLSEQSSYITGENYNITGGSLAQ